MTILLEANEDISLREVRARTLGPTTTTTAITTTRPRPGQTYWDLIDRSDDALLDFDTEGLEHDIDHARALLALHPTTYRNQLTIAKFIEGWIARLTNDAKPCRFNDGFVQALVEMTGHLRDGDFAVDSGDELGHA